MKDFLQQILIEEKEYKIKIEEASKESNQIAEEAKISIENRKKEVDDDLYNFKKGKMQSIENDAKLYETELNKKYKDNFDNKIQIINNNKNKALKKMVDLLINGNL